MTHLRSSFWLIFSFILLSGCDVSVRKYTKAPGPVWERFASQVETINFKCSLEDDATRQYTPCPDHVKRVLEAKGYRTQELGSSLSSLGELDKYNALTRLNTSEYGSYVVGDQAFLQIVNGEYERGGYLVTNSQAILFYEQPDPVYNRDIKLQTTGSYDLYRAIRESLSPVPNKKKGKTGQ